MLASIATDYLLDACPGCGGHLLVTDNEPPIVVQQVDIVAVPLEIHEHRSHPGWCPHCGKTRYAPLPLSIERGGLAGPRLTTVIAYLKGVCHASFSTIRKFVRDVIGLTISRGQLAKIIAKVSRALEQPYEELLRDLPDQDRLNVDETGHKQNGQEQTNHCRNLAKRFEKHEESYFRFITTPGVEPTNNLAEQVIRFVVIDRLITQGTRSEKGNRWCERIWTVIATCTQQGRSVFEYLEAAVTAWFHGEEAPSLLPRVSSSQGQRAGWSIGGRKVREDREATGRMPPGASVARVRRRPAPRG